MNLINSTAIKTHKCPHCGSKNVRKFGTIKGLQRFDCRDCCRKYNALTRMPLAHCNIAHSTAFRWRHIFLKTASHEMSETLDGIVEADETYFPRSYKGKHDDEQEPRKRGGIKGRGLSRNFVGVLVAVDWLGGLIDSILDNS